MHDTTHDAANCLDLLAAGRARAIVTFAGQGIGYFDELLALWRRGGHASALIDAAAETTARLAAERAFAWSGLCQRGFELGRWLRDPATRPDDATLATSLISQPLIFTVQMARFAASVEDGLGAAFDAGAIAAVTGHSQGVMSAVLVAESRGGHVDVDRFAQYVAYFCWQGLHMALSDPDTRTPDGSCMAAVSGVDIERLRAVVAATNEKLPAARALTISLQNTRTRNVVSGHPAALAALEQALVAVAERDKVQRKAGRRGGATLRYQWEPLAVGAAFHSHHMAAAHARMAASAAELGFDVDATAFAMPVLMCDGSGALGDVRAEGEVRAVGGVGAELGLSAAMVALLQSQHVDPVRWQCTLLDAVARVRAIAGADAPAPVVLDLGPSDAVARLSRAALRGTGVEVLALSTRAGDEALRTAPWRPTAIDYRVFAPRLRIWRGRPMVDNRYTRATDESPVILPGMTPTTVDVPICAAAANAGFTAELAGGGQVTEAIFAARVAELERTLEPGREVVFNSLYLDPYLWGLHLGKSRLVQRFRREGAPIKGVTVSAGIPDVAEATALLDELTALGMWHNAFKPGNAAQVKQVCQIAAANRDKTLFVHVEGGKAGGHHSWEDLDELLLETYHLLRAEPNLVLCVGGGIHDEARGVALLRGTWARRYGLPDMPVDAIFLGTAAMAVREATATPAVKAALVAATGTARWVATGAVDGGVTSGKSQLNADIHYLDNAASRCGRLLDSVAGDAEAIAARRAEIATALDKTAKPYFGDLDTMSYSAVLRRMVALMKVGTGTAYEDGVWPDASYRARVADMLRRAEARLCAADEGEVDSLLDGAGADALDAPEAVLDALDARYPAAATTTLHPADVRYFIHGVCARPGKPVNFVPVIDADVRRWYKSDSLWQAQNPRYDADAVLVIPGPEAVAGIGRADEPVAELLGRFEAAVVAALRAAGDADAGVVDTAGGAEVAGVDTLRFDTDLGAVAYREALEAFAGARWARLLTTSHVHLGHGALANPLAALCRPRAGATLRREADDVLVFLRPGGGEGDAEQVRARWLPAGDGGGAVEVEVRPTAREPGAADASLTFTLRCEAGPRALALHLDEAAWDAAVSAFYQRRLFGALLDAPPAFAVASEPVSVDGDRVASYALLTGGVASAEAPLAMGFSLVWRPLFRALSEADIARGTLRLVHLRNDLLPGPGWPVRAGDALAASARVVAVRNDASGRTIETEATLHRGDGAVDADSAAGLHCLTVRSAFYVRQPFSRLPVAGQSARALRLDLRVGDEAERALLAEQGWITPLADVTLAAGDQLRFEGEQRSVERRDGHGDHALHGVLLRDGVEVATVDGRWQDVAGGHPGRRLLDVLAREGEPVVAVARRTLATARETTPRSMAAFAAVGGDHNPIHLSPLMADLAGLDDVIVHGMWTAARACAFLVDGVLGGERSRLRSYEVEFLAPAAREATIALRAELVALRGGDMLVEVYVDALGAGAPQPLMKATAWVKGPRTAVVFPGQGVQQKGMGMAAYASSSAARRVWDRADAFTRSALGFSILRVVRDNPRELVVDGKAQVHDKGVIHLTQFTQVAMAVLAQAQIAQLREAGVLPDDAIVCGHSVGEYNALAALGDVLPLEAVVQTVYARAMEMHRLVARDEQGESGFRMGVVRPHYAGLDEAGAKALVREVAERTGLVLEVVNDNVRGRQYSVVGQIEAIAALREALAPRQRAGKDAWVEVPGIDVPFHSRVLAGGVDPFRATLEARFPPVIPVQKLVGRYIPNLVPRLFSLERAFVEEVADYTGSAPLGAILADWPRWQADPDGLGRALVIELLAWQFASPVRWIETQDLLLARSERGGVGVEVVLEVGVGYQPTLANMARYTQSLLGADAADVVVRNVEADADEVYCLVGDPEPAAPAVEPVVEPATTAAPAASTPVAAGPSQPATAPAAAGPAAPVVDAPLAIVDALRALLAVQARVQPAQIGADESIEELFEGVSSRRNQVLLDLGAEFGLGTIDGAHEQPLGALVAEITKRSPGYRGPGRYLRATVDDALRRVLGRAGLGRKDALAYLAGAFGLGEGLGEQVLLTLALQTREGESSRGGALGALGHEAPRQAAAAEALLDAAVAHFAAATGRDLRKAAGAGGGGSAVDAAVVDALEAKIAGRDGVLMRLARDLSEHLGFVDHGEGDGLPVPDEAADRVARQQAEHGADYEGLVAPRFAAKQHVAFTSLWAWSQRDLCAAVYDALGGRCALEALHAELERLANHKSERMTSTARYLRGWVQRRAHEGAADPAQAGAVVAALDGLLGAEGDAPLRWTPTRPRLDIADDGAVVYREVEVEGADAVAAFVDGLGLGGDAGVVRVGAAGAEDARFEAALRGLCSRRLDFRGQTALVTGAGPSSIALDMVRHLLHGGARVIVTTSTYTPARLRHYRELYAACAGPGAELHVVPFNQASLQDVRALVDWLFAPVHEQSGATVKVVKRPFTPDLLIPFGALKDLGTLDEQDAASQASLRAMLLAVEALIGAIAGAYRAAGRPARPCHVVLPLSPNHGVFGGDGSYAEGKAALEVLGHKWRSEHEAWGRLFTLAMARIGWVRGTGLMDANNPVAAALEARTGVRTFSTAEMAAMLAALCAPSLREAAAAAPLAVDLTGGFAGVDDLKGEVDAIRAELAERSAAARRLADLRARVADAAALAPASAPPRALPRWPLPTSAAVDEAIAPAVQAAPALRDVIVLIGAGEVGPLGSARTRLDFEVRDELSAGAVLELAWTTGLLRFEDDGKGGGWVDAASGEAVAEADIAARYRDAVDERVGIRMLDTRAAGFDPRAVPVMATVFLERDMTFGVQSEAEARSFVAAMPESTRARYDEASDAWLVTRLAGSEIRVPRQVELSRYVAGQVPSGFDPARFGVPKDMVENVDRLTVMNLIATVDAFLSAGLTPEELLGWVHPARVANTQGSGLGGMASLARLYVDQLMDRERQGDILQETLINVVTGYAVQSYVGSYGAMSNPVAACATAAVSVEEAVDKIRLGKADVVLAGGYDDLSLAGFLGFGDMNATCDSAEMTAMGLLPRQFSRANDVRRKGFVEGQGGGSLLVTRGDLALAMGAPVLAIVGYAGSFGDGIQKSVPAPGIGAMAAVLGGADSPLASALAAFGLTADDIALVYKHDTSTNANDPNENELHDRIGRALGRSEGNPLWVVSQKTVTGHAKGGAAAWQVNGLVQAMASGVVPGNKNLDSVDPQMARFGHMGFTDRPLHLGRGAIKAGLVTSLGFGHVSGLVLLLHPGLFLGCLDEGERVGYLRRVAGRRELERRRLAEAWMGGEALFAKRGHRRFVHPDGSDAQALEEAAMLADPSARLRPGGVGFGPVGDARGAA